MANNDVDYKELRQQLDVILAKLNSEDIDIDEATELYDQGNKIVKQLEEYLNSAIEKTKAEK